jgi:hypothetical protein
MLSSCRALGSRAVTQRCVFVFPLLPRALIGGAS